MILFSSITAVLSLIGILCLRKRFSYGIIPIIITSSLVACVLCTIVNVSAWYTAGPDSSKEVVNIYRISDFEDFTKDKFDVAKVRDINKVFINDTITTPYIVKTETELRKDVGLIWKVGYSVKKKYELHLNKKDYEIFKAVKDSIEEGEQSLQKTIQVP